MVRSIVILTGAGISAESGLATFRASDGLWCDHRVEDVATPEGFARDPALVQQFYNMRRAQLPQVKPNAAHDAIARLGAAFDGELLLVTQNVDDLHGRAEQGKRMQPGYRRLHMHGELNKVHCTRTGDVIDWHSPIDATTPCPCCGTTGTLRPHIVWFGEMPLGMDLISDHLQRCDLFLSIGTSGNVYPAAGFVQEVRFHGHAHTVEINLEPTQGRSLFHEHVYGKATEVVPAYVDRILEGGL